MRKLIALQHISLDGYLAGPAGEMNWIKFNEELADHVDALIQPCDTVLYGHTTYDMMEAYWPTAGSEPDASRHDISHANWVNAAEKIVFSRSLTQVGWANTRIVKDNAAEFIAQLKQQPGKDILLLGSASISHLCIEHNLIDEYRLTINPVALGAGIPLFPQRTPLKLMDSITFTGGILGAYYVPA